MRTGININYLIGSFKDFVNQYSPQFYLDQYLLAIFSPDSILNNIEDKVVVFVKSPYKESLHHRWPRQKQTIGRFKERQHF